MAYSPLPLIMAVVVLPVLAHLAFIISACTDTTNQPPHCSVTFPTYFPYISLSLNHIKRDSWDHITGATSTKPVIPRPHRKHHIPSLTITPLTTHLLTHSLTPSLPHSPNNEHLLLPLSRPRRRERSQKLPRHH